MSKQSELYASITDRIIAGLESGPAGTWRAPWHGRSALALPFNTRSRKAYRGVNTWALMADAMSKGYTSAEWGTFKQWKDRGAHVRRGEKGSTVIFWKQWEPRDKRADSPADDEAPNKVLLARSYTVFNREQIDGLPLEVIADPAPDAVPPIERAETFLAAIGANVRHGGASAYYAPAIDTIQLPPRDDFRDSESYYATSAHEHVHWSGHESRLAREFGKRFGSDAYAFEELVAELGAAFVCGYLGLTNEPREDHASYLASWLKVLRADSSAIVTAASQAQKAADYLISLAGEAGQTSDERADASEESEVAA